LRFANTTKIKAQNRKTILGKRMVQPINNFVVHCATIKRVGVEYEYDWGLFVFAVTVTAFNAAFGTVNDNFWHGVTALYS
jgi:hypothetical protein